MRRSVLFLTPLLPFALAACEDGPNQTFQPATGTLFNNGDTVANVTDAGDPLTSTFSASTTVQICGGAELQQQWGAMVAQPLAPVRFMAGLDLDNGPKFPLLTIEQAELGPTFPVQNACVTQPAPKTVNDGAWGATPGAVPLANDPCLFGTGGVLRTQPECAAYEETLLTAAAVTGKTAQCGWNVIPATAPYLQSNPAPTRLCQPTVLGPGGNGSDVGGSILVQWGNNGEFQMEWAVPTHKAYVMYLNPGYVGQMQWNYVDPKLAKATVHTYVYEIQLPIKKDNVNYEIDWLTASAYPGQVDELYRGIASTYAPDIYDDAAPGVTCNNTGTCLAYANAQDGTGRALFGMRPVSFYMFFNPPTLPNPSGFTVNSAYLFNIKYAPYSGITSYFKMYDGPLDGGGLAAGGDAAAAEPFGDGLVGNQVPQKHCHFGMANNFENLLTNCIDVFQPPSGCTTVGGTCDTINQTSQNKVLGDLSHDDQNYTFAVVGINQNFRPVKLDICTPALCGGGAIVNGVCKTPGATTTNCGTDTEDVIHDTDSPLNDPTNNYANTFDSDVRSFGAIQNDYFPPGSAPWGGIPCTAATAATVCTPQAAPDIAYVGVPTICDLTPGDPNNGFCVSAAYGKDTHGSGAVWREYGRLVQTQMNAAYVAMNGGNPALKRVWHDPTCYFPEGCISTTGTLLPANGPTSCATAGGTWAGAEAIPGVLQMAASPYTTCCTPGGAGTSACTAANLAAQNAVCAKAIPGSTCNQTGGAGVDQGVCQVPFDVNSWRAAPGCTGFESWITGAEAAPSGSGLLGIPAAGALAADDSWDIPFWGAEGIGGGFKPGTPQGMFCNDPGPGLIGFFNYCGLSGDIQGAEGGLLDVSTSRLLQYLGQGNVLQLPLEGRDRRYFFQQWSIAYAKYETSPSVLDTGINSAGSSAANQNGLQVDNGAQVELGAVANQFIDLDNFIFDSFGGGANRSEYVDFGLGDANNDPVDIEQKILLLGSNLQATNWYRKLDREERAMFNTLATDNLANDKTPQASWGYLKDPTTGLQEMDTWVADFQPAATCTQAACNTIQTSAAYQAAALANYPGAPPLTCDLSGDVNNGLCVYAYPRRNANLFLTNVAGSAILVNGVTSIPGGWGLPTNAGALIPAPAGWIDPCNPVSTPPAKCAVDQDCPGVMSCTAGACVAAVTPYYCATHSPASDPFLQANPAACGGTTFSDDWTAPVNTDGVTFSRRANGKPLLEGYCGVWQPSPFALTTNAITPNVNLFPGAKNVNPTGMAAGIEVVKTFPSDGEALVSLPTFPNPYNADPTTNKNPVLVMVPWLPFQEGVGYPVSTSGSQDVFVETAQLDFTGQVVTPTVDYLPVPLSCLSNANCTNGQTCQGADPTTTPATPGQCVVPGAPTTNPATPYGISVQAIETQDFLGEVFLCIDTVTSANRLPVSTNPGDILSAHMYSSAETIVNWLASHPGAQNSCQIIVRYSPYDNYPDYITSLSGGVRLDIDQGAGYGRVVDATVFAPGTGVVATP